MIRPRGLNRSARPLHFVTRTQHARTLDSPFGFLDLGRSGRRLDRFGLVYEESDWIGRIGRHKVGRTFGQALQAIELPDIDRLQGKMPFCQFLNARRIIESRPFSTQSCNRVVLAPDLLAYLCKPFSLPRRFEFDLVYVGGGGDERRNDEEVDETDQRRLPLMTSASEGRRGSVVSTAASSGGADVRSAARSFADRARGFSAISAASGVTGRPVRMRNDKARVCAAG